MRLGGVVRAHSVLMGCANLIEPALPTEICARPCSPYSHTGPHLTHPYGSLAVADPVPTYKSTQSGDAVKAEPTQRTPNACFAHELEGSPLGNFRVALTTPQHPHDST